MRVKHDPYAAFRYKAYRLYMFGWFVATVGTRIQSVAIAWEMYQRTGEALSLGFVGLAQAVPMILLALPSGYMADHFERHKVVMVSLLGMTLTSLGLAALSWMEGPIQMMYFLLFLDATAVMLGRPARMALMPQLVPVNVFPNAVTWNISLMQISSVLGPAIGGFIIVWSVPGAYIITAISSLLFILLLSTFNLQASVKSAERPSLQSVLGGVRFVWKTRIILTVMLLDLFAVLLGGAVYLMPIFAEDILSVGPTGYGWLQSAPAAGSFCMALLLIYLPSMQRAGRTLLLSIAGFGVATIVFGLSTSFWLSIIMLFLTGALDNISMVVRHTLMQLLTPDAMRGRVSAVHSLFTGASNELGGLESGIVAHWFGPIVSVVSGGIGTIAVVVITAVASPKLWNYGALDETRPEEEA